jgi:SAM-dependent methyltransferase
MGDKVMNYNSIDWNEVWKQQYEKSIESKGKGDCATVWDSKKKAQEFLERSNKNPERIQKIIEIFKPEKQSTILDVGAGPGTLAVPLAGLAAHVTAVEPANGMAEVMREYAAQEGISNLDIVQKKWEDIDPKTDLKDSYDIVFASHSLGMPDIKESIEKMIAVASGKIYLFWFGGTPAWEQRMIDLWPELYGKEYSCGPKADVIFNLLYSMGIYPNVESWNFPNNFEYPDYNAAFQGLKEQCGISTPKQESVLKDYLNNTLVNENGRMVLPGKSTGIRLWWEVDK